MTTVSIPLNEKLNDYIQSILKAEQEIRDGKGLSGDLDELATLMYC